MHRIHHLFSLGFPLVDKRIIPGDSLAPPVPRTQNPKQGVVEVCHPSWEKFLKEGPYGFTIVLRHWALGIPPLWGAVPGRPPQLQPLSQSPELQQSHLIPHVIVQAHYISLSSMGESPIRSISKKANWKTLFVLRITYSHNSQPTGEIHMRAIHMFWAHLRKWSQLNVQMRLRTPPPTLHLDSLLPEVIFPKHGYILYKHISPFINLL